MPNHNAIVGQGMPLLVGDQGMHCWSATNSKQYIHKNNYAIVFKYVIHVVLLCPAGKSWKYFL